MGLDHLKKQTGDLSNRNQKYREDYRSYLDGVMKLDDILSSMPELDDSIKKSLGEVRSSYESSRQALDFEKKLISEERKEITQSIQEQIAKLTEAQNKLTEAQNNRYGEGARIAAEKCGSLIEQYRALLDQIKLDGLTEFGDIGQMNSNVVREKANLASLEVDTNDLLNSDILQEPATQTASGGQNVAVGWCPNNSMTAVSIDENGQKVVSVSIGGTGVTFPCTMDGLTAAHHMALDAGDKEMEMRCAAMFELETFRQVLDLGPGDSNYAQMGGYHGDVEKQDPDGYDSHHIPARSVQDVNAKRLPAISITKDDHKLTSSYAGNQRHTFQSNINPKMPKITYKDSISQAIAQGSVGYLRAVKNELYDLKIATGGRYDGGISAYLDAVIDMIAIQGVPAAK